MQPKILECLNKKHPNWTMSDAQLIAFKDFSVSMNKQLIEKIIQEKITALYTGPQK